MSRQTLLDKLAQNPRAAGAPQSCLQLEANALFDLVQDSEAGGMPIEDSQLQKWVEDSLCRLEEDARRAAMYATPGEQAS
jgi:hypothetical protein